MVEVDDEGKDALTEFRVLRRFGEFATLIEASPITGRTHQIRVHTGMLVMPLRVIPSTAMRIFLVKSASWAASACSCMPMRFPWFCPMARP